VKQPASVSRETIGIKYYYILRVKMITLTDTIKEFTDYAAKQKALSDRLKSAIEETAAGELGVIDYVFLSGDINEDLRRSISVVSDRISKKTSLSNTIVIIIRQEN
jgi:hypothetical protein